MKKFQPNCVKIDLPVRVRFATEAGVLQTLEGPVQYQSGDALMTGVSDEYWPIRRDEFEASYSPCDDQLVGQDGKYHKRAIPVFAQQLTDARNIALDHGRGVLNGKPGDWLLQDSSGRMWVVTDAIFKISYAALDAPPELKKGD
jgi:PGDYG protein